MTARDQRDVDGQAGLTPAVASTTSAGSGTAGVIRTDAIRSLVPARMDRLPWGSFHTRLVIALGVAWVLDGLEITVASAVASVLTHKTTLGLSTQQAGLMASIYLAGEVVGALVFGRLSDKWGRRKLFVFTLGLYLVFNGLTAISWGFGSLVVFRFIAGMGIGGEYSAINSAIDELIPARHRGHTDLAINGTYWLGAIIGSAAELALLNTNFLGANLGWRLGFVIGPVIGIAIWGLRRNLPESPRWLLMHGRAQEAEETTAAIEADYERRGVALPDVDERKAVQINDPRDVTYREIWSTLWGHYRNRTYVGFALGITQSFLYNAIFFTYTLILTKFYNVSSGSAPLYLFFFAAGNLLGPLTIGRLFDTIGRRPMISGTYVASGVILGVTGWLFKEGALTATSQTILWCVIFFIASAAASSAYLTVSEVFPVEMRAMAIAFFFAIWQLIGGVVAPWVFGTLIGTGDRTQVFYGYLAGAILMIGGGVIEWFLGVEAARKSLEDVARPMSSRTMTEPYPGTT